MASVSVLVNLTTLNDLFNNCWHHKSKYLIKRLFNCAKCNQGNTRNWGVYLLLRCYLQTRLQHGDFWWDLSSSTAGPGYMLVSSQPTSIIWINTLTLLWETKSPRPRRLRRTSYESEAFPFQCPKFTGELAVWTWRVFVEPRLPFPVCGGISWRSTWSKFSCRKRPLEGATLRQDLKCLQVQTSGSEIATGFPWVLIRYQDKKMLPDLTTNQKLIEYILDSINSGKIQILSHTLWSSFWIRV